MIIRMITLLVLAMLGYFGLKNWLRPAEKSMPRPGPKKDDLPDRKKSGLDKSGAEDMVKDPVCDTYVDQSDAPYLIHQGKTIHFCSESCRDRFLKNLGDQNP